MKIQIFTYQNYLKYQEILQKERITICKNNEWMLCEEQEEYCIIDSKINNEHDKIFRKILDDKKEVAKFINKVLKLRYKIEYHQLEKYNSSFVTAELKNQEADIIYKLKERNIFFLIEHQTKIDYSMPLRILEYENEIIKSAIDISKIKQRNYKFPQVISIVLYSGRNKWNVKKYIGEVQEQLDGYSKLELARYNIVDVNNFSEKELLEEESFLSKAMLIEKTRYSNSLTMYLEKIIKEINSKKEVYTKQQKELLIAIINLILNKKLETNKSNLLVKELKGENEDMLAVLEMIEEENKKLIAKGEKKGEKRGEKKTIESIVKKMLQEDADIEFIMRVTGLTKEKITQINNK